MRRTCKPPTTPSREDERREARHDGGERRHRAHRVARAKPIAAPGTSCASGWFARRQRDELQGLDQGVPAPAAEGLAAGTRVPGGLTGTGSALRSSSRSGWSAATPRRAARRSIRATRLTTSSTEAGSSSAASNCEEEGGRRRKKPRDVYNIDMGGFGRRKRVCRPSGVT